MATLTYNPTLGSYWTGAVYINYIAVFNPATNQTTVTFQESSHEYFGRSGYGSSGATTITVKAADNPSSQASATFNTTGSTNGGTKSFTGTPSPVSVTVTHSPGPGVKSITIEGVTTIKVYATSTASSQSTATGSGTVTVTTATAYELTLTPGGHCSLTVTRAGVALATGALIYQGDELTVTFSAASGYQLKTATLNGAAITSPTVHTVAGAVAIVIMAAALGFMYYDNGAQIKRCKIFRDNGTELVRCRFYRDNGSEIEPC